MSSAADITTTTTAAAATPKPTPPPKNSLAELTASRADGKAHLLLAASGSVATIKLPQIATALLARHGPSRLSVRLVLTTAAAHFLAGQSAEQPPLASMLDVPGVDGIYLDEDEWGGGGAAAAAAGRPGGGGGDGAWTRGAAVLHIELRRWADVMAVVPLSANTLAKFVGGICDNLLTSVVRAWDADGRIDGPRKRILVAPAMNVGSLSPPPFCTDFDSGKLPLPAHEPSLDFFSPLPSPPLPSRDTPYSITISMCTRT